MNIFDAIGGQKRVQGGGQLIGVRHPLELGGDLALRVHNEHVRLSRKAPLHDRPDRLRMAQHVERGLGPSFGHLQQVRLHVEPEAQRDARDRCLASALSDATNLPFFWSAS